uniref:Putative secreted protein n=1 Tax=Anopheles marajoara TaxID=58244 RepID=A0A2M4C5N5_9DIPT
MLTAVVVAAVVGVVLPSAIRAAAGSVSSNELCSSAAIRSSLWASLIWLANDSTVLNDSSQYTQRVSTIWVPVGSSAESAVSAERGSGFTNLRERFSVPLAWPLVAGELDWALSGIRFGIGRGRFLGFVSASSSSVETALSSSLPSSSSPSSSSSSSSLSASLSLSSLVVCRRCRCRRAASWMVSLEYGIIWLSWCNSSASLEPQPRMNPLLAPIDVLATDRSISSSSFGSPEAATSCWT